MTITQGFDWLGSSAMVVGGLLSIAVGVLIWGLFIEVNDSTLTFGTYLIRRPYPRSDIAKISIGFRRTAYFIRTDGTIAFSTSGYVWGDKTVAALANYLGVPLTR